MSSFSSFNSPFGLRFALMILNLAKLPLEYVATSFVVAKRTVVVYNDTFSTNQVLDPDALVSWSGGEIATLSPMSYGRLTKIKRIPCAMSNQEVSVRYTRRTHQY